MNVIIAHDVYTASGAPVPKPETFSCDVCKIKFASFGEMVDHARRVHGVNR